MKKIHIKFFFIYIIISVLFYNASAYANDIAAFEVDAVKSNTSSFHSGNKNFSYHGNHYSTGHIFADIFYEVFFWALFTGGASSASRMNPNSPYLTVEPRKKGEPILSFLKVGTYYEWMEDDLYAYDISLQCGWGPFALQLKNKEYNDSNSDINLRVFNPEFLYRISFSKNFEIDFGIGSLQLKGDSSNSGASLSVPFLLYPFKNFGIEFRPMWAEINNNDISDYDICIVLTHSYISVKCGYSIFKSENETLKGSYLGISLHY